MPCNSLSEAALHECWKQTKLKINMTSSKGFEEHYSIIVDRTISPQAPDKIEDYFHNQFVCLLFFD